MIASAASSTAALVAISLALEPMLLFAETPPAHAPKAPAPAHKRETLIDVHELRVIERESGPVNYYQIVEESNARDSFIHAAYQPGLQTVTLGAQVPERLQHGVKKIRWRWRAVTIPPGANDCKEGHTDSAATVYVSFKRGLKWYTLKYVWSDGGAKKGTSCRQKDNMFVSQMATILQSGGPLNTWRTEEIDPSAEFRAHFANNDKSADVPDLIGVAILTDGDQMGAFSSADYGAFTIIE